MNKVKTIQTKEVLMSKDACFRRNINSVVLLFLLIVLTGVVAGKDGFMSGEVILAFAVFPSYIIFFWLCFLRVKTRCHNSVTYKGSLEDLIKEMYIHGFVLKEKVGEFYVLETRYFLLKTVMLVKNDGERCVLFGGYPNELSKKSE